MADKCVDCEFEDLGGVDVQWVWITLPHTGEFYKTDILCQGHRKLYEDLGFDVLAESDVKEGG